MSSLKVTPCIKSELDYFSTVPIQNDVHKITEVCYHPLSTLDKATTIEFRIPGDSETYKDLSSTTLRLKLRVKNGVATFLSGLATLSEEAKKLNKSADTGFETVNNLLHSLFKQCSVYLNNTLVSGEDPTYHFRAYFETILNYSEEAAVNNLHTSGWWSGGPDDYNYYRATNDKGDFIFELIGKLRGDIFNQPKYILNNIETRIVLQKEKSDFYMMYDTYSTAEITIEEAQLYINHIHVNPDLMIAHQKVLESGHNIPILLKKVMLRQFTIAQGQRTLNLDNVVAGKLPNLLIMGMILNEAFVGKRSLDPYNFERYGLKTVQLIVNGISIPSKPIELTTELIDGKTCTSNTAYYKFMKELGLYNTEKRNCITRKRYQKNFFLVCFDLTSDHNFSDMILSHVSSGNIRIEGQFEKPVDKTLTALVLTEFDGLIEIDRFRNVVNTL